jgi:hypothetical protein
MAQCGFTYGKCDCIATTTLTKIDGEVVQFCEKHRDEMIRRLRKMAEDGVAEADHWFILNKIPI